MGHRSNNKFLGLSGYVSRRATFVLRPRTFSHLEDRGVRDLAVPYDP